MYDMFNNFNPMDHPRLFRLIMNSWPPYLGAGVGVEAIGEDWRKIRVGMKLRWYNKNYLRSHFGGSLFSMTDPFFLLMLMANLGQFCKSNVHPTGAWKGYRHIYYR
ncbi:MAG: hypothetical protein ACI8ZB_002898 [Desulforhopalus sp.]|jgi:hypothetical protein